MQGQVRTMKEALGARLNTKIPVGHRVLAWLVEYAAILVNRFEVGHDGRTPYERSKNKTAKVLGLEFMEKVWWRRRPIGGAPGKLSSMWDEGVYLGVKR